MKRVVVTGGAGFIGRETLGLLAEREFEIHLLGRTPPEPCLTETGLRFHPCDLIYEPLEELLGTIRPTHLLHLAWYVEPGRFWSAPQNMDWVAASIRLTRAFTAAGGQRAVFAGTCAEYDWNFHTLDERVTPLLPRTGYGIAKVALYRLLESFGEQIGLSFAWGRIFCPYGPHEPAGKLIGSVIDAIARSRPASCSAGHQIRDFMHVIDVSNALVALLDSRIEGPVNLASGDAMPLRVVIELTANLMGGEHLLRFGERALQSDEPPCLAAVVDRLRFELNFRPTYTLREGLEQTILVRTRGERRNR
jgi:nucleoside-diphosphate-sugar epimerase